MSPIHTKQERKKKGIKKDPKTGKIVKVKKKKTSNKKKKR